MYSVSNKVRPVRVGILAAMMLFSGCVKLPAVQSDVPAAVNPVKTAEPSVNSCAVDPSMFLSTKIKTDTSVTLYRKSGSGMISVGQTEDGAMFDISDTVENGYLPIKDSSLYVDPCSVQASERWYPNRTNLFSYSKQLLTTSDYTIQDDKGKTLVHLSNSQDTYAVYVLPSDLDSRYGIRFQNGIYYIPSSEVQSVTDTSEAVPTTASSIPVLMYHFFYNEAAGESRKDGNWTEVQEFDQQLQYLQDNQYAVLSMREVEYYMEQRALLPEKSIAITIDDNDPSFHTLGYPELKKFGMNACLFVICGWAGETMPYELWEMREDGIELQSHSFLMHQGGCSGEGHSGRLLCTDYETGVADTKQSFEYVDGGFVYCYPFGDVNDNAEMIVRDAGAKLAFTTEHGKINPSMDPLRLPRIRINGGESLDQFVSTIQ